MTATNTFLFSASSYQLFGLPLALSRVRFLLSVFCFLLSSCASLLAADASSPVVSGPVVESPSSVLRPPSSSSNTFATMATLNDKHKLTIGDKLNFRIAEDQEDPNEKMEPKPMMVGDHGDVEVPYIGPFPATGKTCKQLARQIKTELEKKYYYQATVIISLDELAKTIGKVYVLGEVRRTGLVEMPGDETLTAGKAVLRAGGFTNYADKRNVKVTRSSDSAGPSAKTRTFGVDLAEVLEKGRADKDVELQPGDVIYVPGRAINF